MADKKKTSIAISVGPAIMVIAGDEGVRVQPLTVEAVGPEEEIGELYEALLNFCEQWAGDAADKYIGEGAVLAAMPTKTDKPN